MSGVIDMTKTKDNEFDVSVSGIYYYDNTHTISFDGWTLKDVAHLGKWIDSVLSNVITDAS